MLFRSVNGDRMLAILAADGEEPRWIQSDPGAGSQLSIEGSLTTVYLHRMRLTGNLDTDDAAIHLQGGRVHIQRSQIVDNNGGGIEAESNALVHIENSFVGGSGSVASALTVSSSTASVLYSSLASGTDIFVDVYAIECTSPLLVDIRNSFVASLDAVPVVGRRRGVVAAAGEQGARCADPETERRRMRDASVRPSACEERVRPEDRRRRDRGVSRGDDACLTTGRRSGRRPTGPGSSTR